jgi:hypothetical protein
MIKIINKGLNEEGVKQMTKLFRRKFKVNQFAGITSKTQQKFNPNTTMGTYFCKTPKNDVISIPLNWLHYELIEYKIVKKTII